MHGATGHIVAGLMALMLLAVGTLALTKRLNFPFSIALLMVGILVAEASKIFPGALGGLHELQISADLILYVFLPTLVFESAFHLDWRELRKNLAPVLTLAVPGLMFSSCIIAGIVSSLTDIDFLPALLLGAILSATDPVAVIALFKKLGAPQRLTILVEGESLFNDATSIVLARILVGTIAAGLVSGEALVSGIGDFFFVFLGGVLVGWLLGEATAWLLGKVESDPAIEITLTTVLAYLSFLLAEELLHVSGVMATVTAGLSYGNRGWMRVSTSIRSYLEHFWEYMAFVATALIFLMVGLSIDLLSLLGQWQTLVVLIVSMLVARALVVFGLIGAANHWPGAERVSLPYQAVMYWGGLRGAIALAIVLSLPDSLAHKDTFVTLVVGAVLFTLLVQGITMDRLVRWLGLDRPPLSDTHGELETVIQAKRTALQRLPELSEGGMFSRVVSQSLTEEYQVELRASEQALDRLSLRDMSESDLWSLLQLRLLAEERQHLRALFDRGHLDERVLRGLLVGNSELRDQVRFGRSLPRSRLNDTQTNASLGQRLLKRLPESLRELQAQSRVAGDYQRAWALFLTTNDLLARWGSLLPDPHNRSAEQLRATLLDWRQEAQRAVDHTTEQFPEFVSAMQQRHARRLALLAESDAIEQFAGFGRLPSGRAEELLHERQARISRLRGLEIDKLRAEPGALLRKVSLFRDLDDAAFQSLAKLLRARTVAGGENVIVQNERGDSLFVIARGVVRIIVEQDGVSLNIATLMAGDFFGEMALLHQAPRTATVRTVSPCTLYELSRSDYQSVAQANPDIAAAVEKADEKRRRLLEAG